MPLEYSVVIPVFNESGNIKELYRRLTDVMSVAGKAYEIIFVDDGSKDDSYSLLKDIALSDNKVKVISFARNYGQHPAVIAGFEKAAGEKVITLDADLQNPPEEIPRLLAEMEKGYDMVAGRRKERQDSAVRRAGSYMTNLFLRVLTGVNLADYGTMLRVFKRDIVKKIAVGYHKQRLYIPVLLCKITKNVHEIDIAHDKRYAGVSKYSFVTLFKTLFMITLKYYEGFYRLSCRLLPSMREGELYNVRVMIENGKEKSSI